MDLPAAGRRLADDRQLSDISGKIECWENLAPHLDITDAEIAAIKKDIKSYDHQRRELLRRWRKANGDKATYQKLIEAAESSSQEKLAAYICSLIGEN